MLTKTVTNFEGKTLTFPNMAWLNITLGNPARGYTEKRNVKRALELINDNDIVVDVGAFIGEMSVHWGKAKKGLRFHLFEPVPQLAQLCVRNMLANELGGTFQVRERAISDSAGTVKFWFSEGQPVLNGIDHAHRKGFVPLEVQKIPLDHFSLVPDYIKIDVEGHEIKALEGMRETLQHGPILQVELLESTLKRAGHTPLDVVKWLDQVGYDATDNKGRKLNLDDRPGKDAFFLPR